MSPNRISSSQPHFLSRGDDPNGRRARGNAGQAPEGEMPPLARGWKETQDREGRTYYYNASTGETSWDRPVSPSSSVGAGTGSAWLQHQLTQSMQQMSLGGHESAAASSAQTANSMPRFSCADYLSTFGPHITSDNIRAYDRTIANGKKLKVGDCRNELHRYFLKHGELNASMQVLGGPGVGKSFLMQQHPEFVSSAQNNKCLTDDNAFYPNVHNAVRAGLETTIYWVTAPFADAVKRVSERPDGYDLDYQAESHVEALLDFRKCYERLRKYPNFHAVAIVNPIAENPSGAPLASLRTFEGADAYALASNWQVGVNEKFE